MKSIAMTWRQERCNQSSGVIMSVLFPSSLPSLALGTAFSTAVLVQQSVVLLVIVDSAALRRVDLSDLTKDGPSLSATSKLEVRADSLWCCLK